MIHWIKAARLRTLPLSLSGIMIGSLVAKFQGYWDIFIFIGACVTTILFQVLSNFANDYGDGVKGTDNEDRIGPMRMVQSGAITQQQMKMAVIVLSIASLLSALVLIYWAFGRNNFLYSLIFVVMGVGSIAAAIKYTVGKNAYGYRGLADIFVLLFFGFVAVMGSNFLFTKQITLLPFFPAVAVGLWSTAVLNLNNMRDIQSDTKAHKNTLVVKMGFEKAKIYHSFLILFPILCWVILIYLTHQYKAFGVLILCVPMILHLKKVWETKEPKLLDPELKKVAILTFLISLGVGLMINL